MRLAVAVLVLATVLLAPSSPAGAGPWEIDRLSPATIFGPGDAVAWDVAVQPDGLQVEAGEYNDDAFVFRYSPQLGRPDGGFEGAGIVVLDSGGVDAAYGVALQGDGSIVVAGRVDGDAAVWRLHRDGPLDTSFGTGGLARVDLGTNDDAAGAVVVLADGRIVVAGWSGTDLALAALTPSGSPDATFGSAGRVVHDLGATEWLEALAVTANGSLVAAGTKGDDSLVARFSSSGALDTNFGSGGSRVVDAGGQDGARDVTLDALGRPVLAGAAGQRAYLARLTTGGLPDPTFGGSGIVVTSLRGTPAEANGVVVLPDGRIFLAGRSGNDAAVAAYQPTGSVDPAFTDGNAAYSNAGGAYGGVLYGVALAPDGTLATAGWDASGYGGTLRPLATRYSQSGHIATTFGRQQITLEREEQPADLIVQPDGRALTVGTIGHVSSEGGDIGLTRHLPSGDLDPSFGGDGTVVVDHPLADAGDGAWAATLQPDGKILVSGWAACQTGVVRLLPNGTLDAGFGSGGWVRLLTDADQICRAGHDVAVGPGGTILVAVGLDTGPVVIRLRPDGSVDTSWGSGGTAAVPPGIGSIPSSLAVQADGSVVVAGNYALAVARLGPSGAVDTTFGTDGLAHIETGTNTAVSRIALRPDGRILAAGWVYDAFAVAQWTAAGVADPSFGGGDGWVTTRFDDIGASWGGLGARAYDLALLPDGRVVVAGADVSDWGFARYLTDGSLDPTFGADGRQSFHLSPHGRPARAVSALADGSLLALGSIPAGRFDHPVLLHLAAAPPPPPPTTTTTTTTTTTAPPAPPATTPPAVPPPPRRTGYWMVTASGAVYAFGDATWSGHAPTADAVDLEPTPSGSGYWVVDGRGQVFALGDARYLGGSPALAPGESVTSLSRTLSGRGYWLFTTRGRVLPYGDAAFRGDMSQARLNGPVLDSIPTPSGNGYYMVASDGGIFAFGDAVFRGSMGNARLNAPVQSLVPAAGGTGYWLVASDGGVFAFGAPFHGSMGTTRLNKPITGMVGSGNGYLMVAEDGGIFAFGDAVFRGSLGANPPAQKITSVAVLPG